MYHIFIFMTLSYDIQYVIFVINLKFLTSITKDLEKCF